MKKKAAKKPNLLVELTNQKMEAQKSGATAESLRKFQPAKSRYDKKSPVGPSRGGRKGN
ncbi:MAG: hypothetical protein H7061_04620 [Bdellovibrionaceae bacterium]|nr:hypothetical protein [Bdellovibrio sp.]